MCIDRVRCQRVHSMPEAVTRSLGDVDNGCRELSWSGIE